MNDVNDLVSKLGQNLQELMRRLKRVVKKGEKFRLFPNFILNGKDFVALIFSKGQASSEDLQTSKLQYELPEEMKEGIEIKDISIDRKTKGQFNGPIFQKPKVREMKVPEELKSKELDKMRKEMAKLF